MKIQIYFDHNNYVTITLIKRRKINKRNEVYQQDWNIKAKKPQGLARLIKLIQPSFYFLKNKANTKKKDI